MGPYPHTFLWLGDISRSQEKPTLGLPRKMPRPCPKHSTDFVPRDRKMRSFSLTRSPPRIACYLKCKRASRGGPPSSAFYPDRAGTFRLYIRVEFADR